MIRFTRFFAAAAFAIVAAPAVAQYPNKPVTIIVPWPPGGPSDITARPMAKGLGDSLGQNFIIDSKVGASGTIGTAMVAKASPDGYTLMMGSSSPVVITPHVFTSMPYDPLKDLAPITNMMRVPIVIAVHPSVPAKNVKELLAWLGANPAKAQYATAGQGTPQHLTAELFKSAAKVQMTHIPYKGTAPALTDAVAGHVPIVVDSTIAILPHLQAGRLVAVGITAARRAANLPDVATFAEQGYPAVESYAWYGFFATARTPREIIQKLNAEAIKVMKTPEFQKVLQDAGSEYVGDTPENFAAFVQAESVKWGRVARENNIKLE